LAGAAKAAFDVTALPGRQADLLEKTRRAVPRGAALLLCRL